MRRIVGLAAAFGVALTAAQGSLAATALLTPAQVDASRLLPPPPAAGSQGAADDMAGVAAAVARRTPAEAALAARDAEDETGAYFASAIGPGFDLAKLPKTRQLLDDIGETEEVVAKAAKAFFHRERPYAVAPQLATCTPHKPGAAPSSYPSGHATRSFSMGIVLAELLPAKAQAILTRAAAYAENRVVCGVHFPSDIVAGQALGTAIAESLPQSAAFRMEFDAAKAELTAAGL